MRTLKKAARVVLNAVAAPLAFALLSLISTPVVHAEIGMTEAGQEAFKIFRSDASRGWRSSNDDSGSRGRQRSRSAKTSSDDDSDSSGSRRRSRGRQVASLGGGAEFAAPRPQRSITGGGNVSWAATSGCLNGTLRGVVAHVAANYGSVTVTSTCRSASSNRAAGGAPKSYHLSGDAVDLRVHGNASGAAAYLASLGGGYKNYGGGLFHVDTGPRRPF